jgi:ATP-dependent Clp protease ATP-binding subunit ClpC
VASLARQLQHAINQFLSLRHGNMWGRFTDPTRRVIAYSQQEAQRLGWNTVSTEHPLLGSYVSGTTWRSKSCIASMPMQIKSTKKSIDALQRIPRLSRMRTCSCYRKGKQVIDFASEEALRLSGKYIGTEHILLGLLREESGIAGQILRQFGIDLNKARSEVALLRDREL